MNRATAARAGKTPMWERAENALGGTYTNAAVGIGHRVIQDPMQDPKLNFFVTGPSNTGATLENWWTLRFRENWE